MASLTLHMHWIDMVDRKLHRYPGLPYLNSFNLSHSMRNIYELVSISFNSGGLAPRH